MINEASEHVSRTRQCSVVLATHTKQVYQHVVVNCLLWSCLPNTCDISHVTYSFRLSHFFDIQVTRRKHYNCRLLACPLNIFYTIVWHAIQSQGYTASPSISVISNQINQKKSLYSIYCCTLPETSPLSSGLLLYDDTTQLHIFYNPYVYRCYKT